MLAAIFQGVLMGFFLAILIGPVFFSLIRTSINKGFYWGAMMAIGVALSDIIYILITYSGISQLIEKESFQIGLGLVGGTIMTIFGIVYIFKKQPSTEVVQTEDEMTSSDSLKYIIRGFGLNAISPAVPFFWLGVVGFVTIKAHLNTHESYAFYIAVVLTTFSTDVLKSFLADKLSDILNPRVLHKINLVAGAGLLGFGIKLLYESMIKLV